MSHPPKVEECLANIKEYCLSIKADSNGNKHIDASDILWCIAQFPQSVEDYLQHTQTKIPLDDKTFIRLHYRPKKDSAND
jgi:hypothetical protein